LSASFHLQTFKPVRVCPSQPRQGCLRSVGMHWSGAFAGTSGSAQILAIGLKQALLQSKQSKLCLLSCANLNLTLFCLPQEAVVAPDIRKLSENCKKEHTPILSPQEFRRQPKLFGMTDQ